ncbi:MAG: TrkH family potassium uptake protein [Bryobacteraceae bacterium]|nr:TrkH family potassium uptake protein [Bryobacteraceae bacterium]MDW8377697.1 TrkH family potassium uptake protein [Bryobacterales bacterium]
MPELVEQSPRVRRKFHVALTPAQLIAFSFAGVIAAGTFLLYSPAATNGEPLRFIDAFFTAVSATCVTGLAVFDVSTRLSWFGQLVLLACIQIGGLGLMTLTTLFVAVFGGRMGVCDRLAIQESYHHSPTVAVRSLILHVTLATFVAEAVGAALLFTHWSLRGHLQDWTVRAYHAAFHSISAFCNAGFTLYSDNMMGFAGDFFTQAILSGLVIAGGLGFLVSLDLRQYLWETGLHSLPWLCRIVRQTPRRSRPRLSVHTKVVLSVTILLLLIGVVSYFLLERRGVLAQMTTWQAWWNAWFCAVTARTAGFNTLDYAQMSGPALMCTMALMFIGASPGSTGGGIKTSTFGILVAHAIFRLRGRDRLHCFGRTIPEETIERAHAIVVSAIAVVVLAVSVVIEAETQRYDAKQSRELFLPVLFETISAFATVGLSMNLTPTLTTLGKFVIAVVMFVGRIGPLTVAVAVASRARQEKFHYAEENIMVG